MKKILVYILMAMAIISCQSEKPSIKGKRTTLAQYSTDTIAYVRDCILGNRKNFEGQSIKYFLDHIDVPIKSYLSKSGGQNICVGLYLNCNSYNEDNTRKDNGEKPVTIIVYFRTPLSSSVAYNQSYYDRHNWTPSSMNFFGNMIISKIDIMDYMMEGH